MERNILNWCHGKGIFSLNDQTLGRGAEYDTESLMSQFQAGQSRTKSQPFPS
jgi:hypothetical protein